ncbi:MAG: hypothetical protein F9K16_03510 [Thermoanaerobaculia bacterium]|nr:MAG: hypothetical protein F9K16_03510 [Thermoanaerobaculia bacterium]MBZ0101265.1 hypothetical protein [Thermoanaerobaculia bacterium]
MTSIRSPRITRHYTQRIEAPPARVFPLLCPVREADWLEGWGEIVEMVHSDSGLAEDGCVFLTRPPGQVETVWVITRHDPTRGEVEFVRVTPGLLATRLCILVQAAEGEASTVKVTYQFTPLSEAGVALAREAHSEETFRRSMVWWEASMNHWLRTGELLRREAA